MPIPQVLVVKNLKFCFSIIKRPKLHHRATTTSAVSDQAESDSDDYEEMITNTATPDLANVIASNRFFFSSPGRSNSIVDSMSVFDEEEKDDDDEAGVAVEKYSDDPYSDFRRSMEEMVVARGINVEVGDSWKSLQELFHCYLSLNPKHTHKFIVAAFSDLLLSLLAAKKFVSGRQSKGLCLASD